MSDAMTLRVDRLEGDVDGLRRWRDGNGKPGAAAMLADHEKRIMSAEAKDEEQGKALACIDKEKAVAAATERQVIIEAVGEAMKKRGKSREGIVRAFGPYAAAIASIIIALLARGS
jgi:hypothetical protein